MTSNDIVLKLYKHISSRTIASNGKMFKYIKKYYTSANIDKKDTFITLTFIDDLEEIYDEGSTFLLFDLATKVKSNKYNLVLFERLCETIYKFEKEYDEEKEIIRQIKIEEDKNDNIIV